uniref:(S)-2-hydroxy-acid oxidase n=1 Tax=Peromyscus maniculatus bairdii TaxID=230844 RepID=A0A8C8UBQ2_PERMB
MSLVCVADFKARAQELLSKSSWDFIEGEADEGITYKENIAAFKRSSLYPLYLRDVSEVDTRTTIQGREISAPICISPTALHSIAWPDGERSTARAAVCSIICFFASCSVGCIVAAVVGGFRWFLLCLQFYLEFDWELIRRVVGLVFAFFLVALVVPVVGPMVGILRRDLSFEVILEALLPLAEVRSLSELRGISYSKGFACGESFVLGANSTHLPSTTFCWNDLSLLQSMTQLPIILKGILTKEDAELAVKHNVQGILVSNHGGRQLDEVPASIDALTEVVAAVKGKVEVYMDGGVRTGNDVLKALALGAKCVFLGRPILWGLAYKGEHGVKEVLNILKTELHTSMALSGMYSVLSPIQSFRWLVYRQKLKSFTLVNPALSWQLS